MPKVLKTLPAEKRVRLWVYQGDPTTVDQIFDAIGMGYMTRHQQYAYMAQCTAKLHKVKLPTGVQ